MHLALVMVARDEAERVERALASARPYVDEMVILDLGSGAAAVQRFADAGARVVSGEWSDDAARCRNAALEAADADWNLVLDPEEWLAEGAEDLRSFVQDSAPRVGLVEVRRGGGGDEFDLLHHPHLSPRLLPRGVRYEGAYQEEPLFEVPVVRTDVVLASDDTETGRWRSDPRRNEALLQQALALRPGDSSLLRQLADELRLAMRYAEAATRYGEALAATSAVDPQRHAMAIGALECSIKAGLLPQAVALMDEFKGVWPDSPDIAFLVGDLMFEMMLTTPQFSDELAPLVESSWRTCLDLGERPDLPGAVHGRGSFLAAQNLYVLCLVLGRGDDAEMWSERASTMRIPASSSGGLLG